MPKKYVVSLTDDEKRELTELTKKGKTGARKLRRAHTLLLADDGKTDREIAENLHIGVSTVERTRRRFVEGGPENALNERRRPGRERLLNGRQEAILIAEACADPPEGRVRWTMQLLADRIVELGIVGSVSDDTVCRILKKRCEALANQAVVHSDSRSGVCLPHGGRTGSL